MSKNRCSFLILGLIVMAIHPSGLHAQQETSRSTAEFPDTLNRKGLIWVAGGHAALFGGVMAFGYNAWFKDSERVPFHFVNDNAGYMQIDKLGHAKTAYVESYFSYYSLRNIGVAKNKALIASALTGFSMQLSIEILDGLYDGWGFSWSDIAANTFGSALMAGQEYFFDDQVIQLKFSYWPSVYQDMANGYLGNNAFEGFSDDYNGHTYWLSGSLNRILGHSPLPPWINLSLGYSAGGMFGEFENITEYNGVSIPDTRRYRQFLISLDVDWTKIPTNSGFLRGLFLGLNLVKIPFPAIEYNTKGEFRGHWLYF